MSNLYTPPEQMAQGFAQPATQEEINKETTYTNPNLHRRIDESAISDHQLAVFGSNSYRLVKLQSEHDEESTTSEVP